MINANINEDGVSMKTLLVPFIAKFVRIRPLTWHQRICLRLELFGCPGMISDFFMIREYRHFFVVIH